MSFAVRSLIDGGTSGGGGGGGGGSFTPVTHQYSAPGSFTEVIPTPASGAAGPAQLVIELGGPGGGGSFSPYLTRVPPGVSGSGGSGALCRVTLALTVADYGATFNITLTPGGAGGDPVVSFNGSPGAAASITNGTFTRAVGLNAGGGQGGTWNPGAGGVGGIASGGQVNLNGNQGQGNTLYPTPSKGGIAVQGLIIASGAGGDAAIVANGFGASGLSASAAFAYT